MASPPFEVEDQTDEDFFDKLVDDEFGVTESGPGFAECGNSDEVKALSNLSIDEVGTSLEGSSGEGGVAIKEEKHSEDVIVPSSDAPEKDILVAEESISLVSSNSFSFDNLIETSDVVLGAAVASDSTTSKSSESRGISVKEVQWSAFNKDSAQRSGGGFGSYSDFFTELGDNSDDPFGRAENNPGADSNTTSSIAELAVADFTTSSSSVKHQGGEAYEAAMQQSTSGQDGYSSQYWENMYPGWRYESSTGEWHQLDNYDARTTTQDSLETKAQSVDNYVVSDRRSEVSYLQQTTQSVVGTIAEGCTTGSVSNCNQVSQGSTEYPPNMVFDPQYPGWYYDTIAQEWRLLESYTPPVQSMTAANYQQNQNENASKGGFLPDKDHSLHGEYGQVENFGSQVLGGNEQIGDWAGLASNHNQQNMNMWQPEAVAKSVPVASYTESQQLRKHYGFSGPVNNYTAEQMGFKSSGTVPSYEKTSLSYDGGNEVIGFQSFVPAENYSHQLSQTKVEQNQQMHFSHDYYGSQKSGNFPHQPFQTVTQHSYAANEGRSSAGRPPHALVTFGFGGKLIVMKDNSSMTTNSAYGSQDSTGSSVSILNLVEVVMDKIDAASIGISACDYFRTLCQQSFPGPLVGGNVGSKELNKWIDERIANCESPNMDYRKGEVLRLLLSLLKIACQHFGKLRSTFGTDTTLKENDCPESAVAKLFASAKRNGAQQSQYGALTHCLQNMPSEGQILATAAEVQNLLVSGRTKEALQCAQEGQLWGPALILAAQLGDQFYVDTVKQMAHRQLVAGSPLRTLCLLIAGQPRDVFSTDSIALSGLPGGVNISQHPAQIGTSSMLDDWEDNLAIITANPTKDDAFVIVHLGDCLWKDRGEVAAAHTCYLVAEANFESYSDSARLCLIGADHWKYPRTYASPEAIQRTELYEYSQVLGNSQSILLPFQPYKIIYAHMLAEVGKVSDSYKYCQSMLKSLKTGRAPEVGTWKQLVSSLEERIRIHQQGGYSTNLAPAKLVGKLLPFIDRSIHRMIGAPPPPVPSTSQSFIQSNEHEYHSVGPRVANSQSTMAMSSLIPSTSMEPISEWTGDTNRMAMPNRSISEPDIGRSPKQGQVGPSKEAVSSGTQGKASVSGGPSRFGRFGSQLLQKTLGWVARSHSDRQAKLGEKNKFYYDEKLKRWVEEGSDPPAEEIAPPPPPTTATFQNGISDYNVKNAFKSESLPANGGPEIKSSTPERSPGIPPIPPSSNQFSARGRIGVRSRYVDTFNKGGGTPANLFQPASVPAAKPGGGANAKFFIPTPIASGEQTVDTVGERMQETMTTNEDPTTSVAKESLITDSSPPSLQPPSMHRFPSMDNITPIRNKGMEVTENGNGSLPYRSRRTASWSGSVTDAFNLPKITEIKPLGEALSMPPSLFMPRDPSPMRLPMNGVNLGDDLHEVEL